MMDKQDMKAQTELGQKLAGTFGEMGRVRPVYEPENLGDGGSANVSATEPKPKSDQYNYE